jgi:peroxiredoxin
MKNILFLSLILLGYRSVSAQSAYQIHLQLKPFANSKVYLGYYYGKIKAVADSVVLDGACEGDFRGKEKLAGGIYFIVSPKKEILFEVLIDQQQHFSIAADSARIPGSIRFSGSPDNDQFQQYTAFMNKQGIAISNLQKDLSAAKTKKDSALIRDKIREANAAVISYRAGVEKKYPASLLTTLLRVLREPVVPPASQQPGGKYDTSFAYHYFKNHYWDSISFTDDRLIRTPVFEPKLDRYYKELVPPDPDSINREIDHMLLYSRTNAEMFKYLLIHFVQKYINPEYMGQDAVFVHLFEKYINTGQAEFFTEKYRKFVNDRAYSVMANLIGQPAPNLEMTNTLEKTVNLYDIPADFILVCFWDPTCSHCKETVPRVDSIYQAKWKAEGVRIFGVMVEGGKDNWLNFIKDHNLNDWINVYQTSAQHDAEASAGHPDYRQLYDVYQTPVMFLLDKDKRIIAKKLAYAQFDEIISLKLKNRK